MEIQLSGHASTGAVLATLRRVTVACAVAILAASPALAQDPSQVAAQNVWARATPPGAATGAIYLTLTAKSDDRLTGATSPLADRVAVHEMHMDGDIMRMNPVAGGVALPAGKPVTLRPGGYHLMMEGLKAPLRQGQTVPLHLSFQNAPALDVAAQVQSIGAAGPAAADPAGHDAMPGMKMGK